MVSNTDVMYTSMFLRPLSRCVDVKFHTCWMTRLNNYASDGSLQVTLAVNKTLEISQVGRPSVVNKQNKRVSNTKAGHKSHNLVNVGGEDVSISIFGRTKEFSEVRGTSLMCNFGVRSRFLDVIYGVHPPNGSPAFKSRERTHTCDMENFYAMPVYLF